MATLETTDGVEFHFDPSAVAAVADYDPTPAYPGTAIFGLTKGVIKIDESADDFLIRLGITRSFAKLTRLDGGRLLVNGKAVKFIRPSLPGDYAPGGESVISVGGFEPAVKETPDQVRQVVNGCGGSL